jgi:hypothetical protein
MTSQPLELEGTWEEILKQAPELAGRRLRVTVLSEEPQPNSAEKPANFRPASGRSLLRHAGTWEGDDLEECLQIVHDTRSPVEL